MHVDRLRHEALTLPLAPDPLEARSSEEGKSSVCRDPGDLPRGQPPGGHAAAAGVTNQPPGAGEVPRALGLGAMEGAGIEGRFAGVPLREVLELAARALASRRQAQLDVDDRIDHARSLGPIAAGGAVGPEPLTWMATAAPVMTPTLRDRQSTRSEVGHTHLAGVCLSGALLTARRCWFISSGVLPMKCQSILAISHSCASYLLQWECGHVLVVRMGRQEGHLASRVNPYSNLWLLWAANRCPGRPAASADLRMGA